jgi:hypothetical protein
MNQKRIHWRMCLKLMKKSGGERSSGSFRCMRVDKGKGI